jgi:hypothetical protein
LVNTMRLEPNKSKARREPEMVETA